MKLALGLLVTFCIVSTNALHAQNIAWLDSITTRLEKAENLKFSNPDQALAQGQKALTLSQKQRYRFQEGKAYQVLSRIHAERGEYTDALKTNHAGLTIFQELDKPREICTLYLTLGVINRYLKLYNESIAANLQAEKLAQTHAYTDLQAAIYGNLGNVYFDKNDYSQALKYHLKSLEIDQARNNEQGMGNSFHNIGMIYRTRKEFSKAIEYYTKSLNIDLKKNNQRNIAISYADFTDLYMEMGDFRKALEYAENVLKISQSINSKRLQSEALFDLPIIHAALGNPEKALTFQQQYSQLSDSLQSVKLSEQIAEMQTRFQAEQKDKELRLQNLRLETQQVSLKQQQTFIMGLMIAVLFGLLIAFLLFNRYKLQQKNIKLSLENEQFRLSKNLRFREDIDETIHYFATSLYGKNTVDEILWDVAKNCISRLGFVDCVIYLLDEEQQVLVQKAAFGTKNPQDYTILDPILIPVGQGIVGSVALSGKPERIADTTLDARYLLDDEQRYSELAVPLALRDKVIGVIDSEHPEKNFFTPQHLEALKTIAALCSSKIAQAWADEEAKKSKLVQLEAENIKKLDSIKSQFFANISHEFRTPLQLILAPLRKKEEEISAQEISMIERNANRLLRLVNQLLDLTKAEVGMLKLDVRQGDILYFLRTIAQTFVPLTKTRGITYQIDLPNQALAASFDPDKVEKMVYNLLSNAIKFTPAGGEVRFQAVLQPGNRLCLVVSDSGIGIPNHLQAKIFDRFFQIDSSQTRPYEGTGIGLALTKELVDLCQGTISFTSREGEGSSFAVLLPLAYESHAQDSLRYARLATNFSATEPDDRVHESLPEPEPEQETRPTVLLVEDHEELRNYLKNQLAEHFRVEAASQGDEGLEVARKIVPDLIITDIMMPVMDGVTLTRHLKEDTLTSHIPVIMLTAKDDRASKKDGFEKGAEQYLVKPFDFDELLACINSLLRQRNRLRIKYSREVILQPTATTIPDREAEFLEKAIRIIDEHMMDESFTVEVLQKKIGMSRMQLHRKLVALTDQSTSDFIRFIRLKRAADLLQKPGLQIAEVAYLSGFSHMSYFSKCFKEQFGMLPSEYARQYES